MPLCVGRCVRRVRVDKGRSGYLAAGQLGFAEAAVAAEGERRRERFKMRSSCVLTAMG